MSPILPDSANMSLEDAAAAWAGLGLRLCYENEDGERPVGKVIMHSSLLLTYL